MRWLIRYITGEAWPPYEWRINEVLFMLSGIAGAVCFAFISRPFGYVASVALVLFVAVPYAIRSYRAFSTGSTR